MVRKNSAKFLVTVSVLIVVASCRKDSSPPAIFKGATSMALKVDGVEKVNTEPVSAILYEGLGTLQILGKIGAVEVIAINIGNLSEGIYDLSSEDVSLSYTSDVKSGPSTVYSGVSGRVIITSVTARQVKGTFQIVAKNDLSEIRNLTEGSFTARISKL